jgi:acyl-coenzyme A thioesterase PaaI-like protein
VGKLATAACAFYESRMRFSEVLASMVREGDEFRAEVDDTWLQGRSLFGGIQGAIAVSAMRSVLDAELPLRVLQMTFMAPVPAGQMRVRPRVLRAGKSATYVEAPIVDGQNTLALVVGIFGSSRTSKVRVVPEQPEVTSESPFDMPFLPGLSPNFVQHVSQRWLRGGLPFTASASREMVLAVALRDEGTAAIEQVVAIADAVPPVALALLDARAFGSSMTWTLEMLTDSVNGLPLEGYRLDAEIVAGQDGYTSQSVLVWGPGGKPLALSRQSMVVFG